MFQLTSAPERMFRQKNAQSAAPKRAMQWVDAKAGLAALTHAFFALNLPVTNITLYDKTLLQALRSSVIFIENTELVLLPKSPLLQHQH